MKYPILVHPHEKLKTTSYTVFEFDETLNKALGVMETAMREAKGIGIAANQIGLPIAAFIIVGEDGVSKEYINPKIHTYHTPVKSNEGCLSLPGTNATITRYDFISVQYQNAKGELFNEDLTGRDAIVFQHELDHLKGKLFINHLSKLKYDIVTKKYKRIFYSNGRGSLVRAMAKSNK